MIEEMLQYIKDHVAENVETYKELQKGGWPGTSGDCFDGICRYFDTGVHDEDGMRDEFMLVMGAMIYAASDYLGSIDARYRWR